MVALRRSDACYFSSRCWGYHPPPDAPFPFFRSRSNSWITGATRRQAAAAAASPCRSRTLARNAAYLPAPAPISFITNLAAWRIGASSRIEGAEVVRPLGLPYAACWLSLFISRCAPSCCDVGYTTFRVETDQDSSQGGSISAFGRRLDWPKVVCDPWRTASTRLLLGTSRFTARTGLSSLNPSNDGWRTRPSRVHAVKFNLGDTLRLGPSASLASGLDMATNVEASAPMRWSFAMMERPSWILQPVPTEPA
jgi:hypothetical protein